MTAARFDPYQAITDQIIALLEAGTAPWRKPWDATVGMPISLTTGKVYRGINPFLLQMAAYERGYRRPEWATYKAIAERGGQVRKGEKSTMIIFWKSYEDKEIDPDTGKPRSRFVLRTYRVFNVEQADGLTLPELSQRAQDHDPIAACEDVIARYLGNDGPSVRLDGNAAHYAPVADDLTMPPMSTFATAEGFYATYFHELTHSTGHADRLARPDLAAFQHFGDRHYSKEELVAEMGAAFLAGHTGIAPATLENSAAYLASWLRALKSDSKLVVQAAAQAQRAADMVLGVTWAEQSAPATVATAVPVAA